MAGGESEFNKVGFSTVVKTQLKGEGRKVGVGGGKQKTRNKRFIQENMNMMDNDGPCYLHLVVRDNDQMEVKMIS